MPDEKWDANDVAAALGPGGLRRETERLTRLAMEAAGKELGLILASDLLLKTGGRLREPIIEGLLRAGETFNIIAPPKVGKSFLVDYLALCIAAGKAFLCPLWFCTPGRVVVIDSELHEETIAYRLERLREAMGLLPEILRRIHVVPMRGKWQALPSLLHLIRFVRHLEPRLVIFDPLYRFLPAGISENDNAEMAQVYNTLDGFAEELGTCGVALVHHASKGVQANKGVTDVGSGAGSQSRATDVHFVLREHEKPEHFVAEACVRSWPPAKPLVLRWEFPLWTPTEHDPEKLKGRRAGGVADYKAPAGPLTAEALASCLPADGAWLAESSLAELVRQRESFTRSAAREQVKGFRVARGLDELTASDGPRDCGGFEATIGTGRGGGLKFRLKDGAR